VPSEEVFAQLNALMGDKAHDIYSTVGSNVTSGQHVEAVRISWLLEQTKVLENATLDEREHIFPLLYKVCDTVCQLRAEAAPPVKLSVDTFKDLERIRSILADKSTPNAAEIVSASAKFDAENPFIGEHGAYLIAEIGGNHEGDFEYAKKLVRDACATDVDAVKLQIYSPDLLINSKLDPDRWEHFKRFALSLEQYNELFQIIREAGKQTCASVWSLEELDLHKDSIDILKVGSGDLNAAPMLRALAKLNKPLVISTGLATMDEVEKATEIILATGLNPNSLAVLQCTSMYPIPDVEANLSVMSEYERHLNCLIGYSDHTVGYETLLDSVSAGAKILEFHFSDDTSNANFRDHLVSLDQRDTAKLVEGMRRRIMRLGSAKKHLTLLERSRNHQVSFHKGVFLRRDIAAGDTITEADMITLRPLVGIDAVHFYDLVGKVAIDDISALDALTWDMFTESEV
ncbi:MAG: N-acetylneuraminate synthase family protein, partial [Paracoccaceae bacterium]